MSSIGQGDWGQSQVNSILPCTVNVVAVDGGVSLTGLRRTLNLLVESDQAVPVADLGNVV